MAKLIVVMGATGQQGGGVVNILLKAGWRVRAITRNSNSKKAVLLVSQGAEVVSANSDDEESLVQAFRGAHAIFGVTNFWEHLSTGKNRDESGELEAAQAWKLARAAARTPTLEHYIWSTLPFAKKLSGGECLCPHFDYKAEFDERLKVEIPELAAKTTFLFMGYYPSNMALLPMTKPVNIPGSGKWALLMPTPPSSTVIVSGDMDITPGVWARQILSHPDMTKGRYASVAPENLTFGDMLKIWSEVYGREGVYVQTTVEEYGRLWGPGGFELASQLAFSERVPDWTIPYDHVSMEDLNIKPEEVPGFRATLEGFKARGM